MSRIDYWYDLVIAFTDGESAGGLATGESAGESATTVDDDAVIGEGGGGKRDLELERLQRLAMKELFLLLNNTLFFWRRWDWSISIICLFLFVISAKITSESLFERVFSSFASLFSLTSIFTWLNWNDCDFISKTNKKIEIGILVLFVIFLPSNSATELKIWLFAKLTDRQILSLKNQTYHRRSTMVDSDHEYTNIEMKSKIKTN